MEKKLLNEYTIQRDEIINLVFEICNKKKEDYPSTDLEGLSLIEDLGFESVMLVDLLLSLEEKYKVEFTDMTGLLENLETLGCFSDYIERNIGEQTC